MRYLVRDMLVYSNNMMAEMIGLAAAQRLSNQPLAGLEAAGTLLVQHLGRLMPEVDWQQRHPRQPFRPRWRGHG